MRWPSQILHLAQPLLNTLPKARDGFRAVGLASAGTSYNFRLGGMVRVGKAAVPVQGQCVAHVEGQTTGRRNLSLYRACQKQSKNLFSFNLVIREADYEQSGETMVYVDKGNSGQPVYRHFCGRCRYPILATIAAAPGKVVVKAGTLDTIEGLQPRTEIYTDHAVKWLAPVAGAARFARNQ